MLIGICGGICAGKSTVAQYLVDHHGFRPLFLDEPSSSRSPSQDGDTSGETDKQTPFDLDNDKQELMRRPKLAARPSAQPLVFPSADALLDFVTRRWRERWVTTDIPTEEVLEQYNRRPFFLLISVDAPLTVRWARFVARQRHAGVSPTASLEQFVARSDQHLYDPVSGLLSLISQAAVRLLNTSSDLAHLYATLSKVELTNEDRLRPSWDTYFMALADLAAQRSNCMKRRVGCVLVRERRVVSTGYNGTPRGLVNCGEGGCARCNSGQGVGLGLATCLCIHAEENALLEAGRERIREGAIIYCNTCPCLTCSIKIVQVGISEVVYSQGYSMDTETARVFREAGVKLRQFVPPANGLIHLEKMDLF